MKLDDLKDRVHALDHAQPESFREVVRILNMMCEFLTEPTVEVPKTYSEKLSAAWQEGFDAAFNLSEFARNHIRTERGMMQYQPPKTPENPYK